MDQIVKFDFVTRARRRILSNEQGRRYCPDRIVTCAAIVIKYAFRRLGRVPRKYFIIAARYFHNLAECSTYRAMKMLFARRHFSSIIRSFSLSLFFLLIA